MMRCALIQCVHCTSKVIGRNRGAPRPLIFRDILLAAHRPPSSLQNHCSFYSSLHAPSYEAPSVTFIKEYTERLLEHVPVGSMWGHDWQQAYPTFLWWTQQGTPESVEIAWRLLDRLVEEEHQCSSGQLKSYWLNRIVEISRTVTVNDEKGVPQLVVGPLEWIDRLDKYAPHLEPNAATYSMIMFALTKWIDEPTVELVESLLDRMEEEESKRDEGLLEADDHVAVYNAVLFAWANSGLEEAPRRAEAVFERMMKHNLEPDLRSYGCLVTTWARSQDPNAGQRAEHILRQMSAEGTEPNNAIYNSVIQAWERSKAADSPKRADILFREMMNLYERNGNDDVKPDATTFRIVIRKLAYNGQVGRADAIIRQMQQMYQDGHIELKPSRKLFDAILHDWANARTPSAPHHAESFLRFMNNLYVSGDIDMKPSHWNFSAAIAAWTKSQNYNSAVQADALLDWMDEFRQAGDDEMVPNTMMCTSIISAWTRSHDKSAPERAEALFQRMMEWYEAGNESVKPNLITYKSLINVWAKSRHANAPERVEAILRLMRSTGTEPDVACYNLLMNAYANSNDTAASERVEAVLQHLIDRHEAGDERMKPDTISFTTVMKAWGNSKVEGAAEQAEAFLRYMENLYNETGDEDIKPNVVCYAMALRAWINSGHPDAAKRAGILLEEVHAKYKAGDATMKLKKQVYFDVMQLLAKSEEVDSGQVAERILLFMQDLGLAGDTHMLPGVKYFNLTLRAWSSSRHMLAAHRAEAILNLMKELRAQGVRPDLKPNRLSFNFVIKAWSKSSDVFAGRRAEQLLHRMQELATAGETDLTPNPFTYGDLAVAWKTSGHADATKKAKKYEAISKAMYKEMKTASSHEVERGAE